MGSKEETQGKRECTNIAFTGQKNSLQLSDSVTFDRKLSLFYVVRHSNAIRLVSSAKLFGQYFRMLVYSDQRTSEKA